MIPGKPKALKRNNRKAILDFLRNSDQMSASDISEKIGLSRTTVMKIVEYFLDKGLVVQSGKGVSTEEGGKKPILFSLKADSGFAISVHIFPDELYGIITDLKVNILYELSVPLKPNEECGVCIDKVSNVCRMLLEKAGVAPSRLIGIAIGSHGVTNSSKGIILTSPHFPLWGNDIPIKDLLLQKLGFEVPVLVDNQIRFQAFAEKTKGIAQEKSNIVVIEGGIGLVAGIIMKNEIKRGIHYLAGEIGHMIINADSDEQCVCGGKGCFEVMVSARRILRLAQEGRKEYPDSRVFVGASGGKLTPQQVFNASIEGDPLALKLMDDVIHWFSIGISNIILMYDPEMIIIHGLYSAAGDDFLKTLRERVHSVSLVKIRKNGEIEFGQFGKERGAVGGAAFVIADHFNKMHLYGK